MLKWVEGLFDRLFAVGGALVFSQIPLFIQQYMQRLAGHVAELQLQVNKLMDAASFSGKTLDQLVNKFLTSGDVDFVRQGEIMHQTILRYDQLNTSLQQLQTSSPLSKLFIFFQQIDWKIAEGTFDSFAFGINLNWEGMFYILFGILIGISIYHFLLFNMRMMLNMFGSLKRKMISLL